jgi:MFS family permease
MSGVGEQLRESKDALARVFENPSLRRLNLALGGSVIGDWAFGVAMSVYVYQRGGAATLGVFGVVKFVTMALLAPFIAVLADRLDRRRVMLASDLTRAALITISTVVVVTDGPDIVVYALALLSSIVGLSFRPAQAALLPSLARSPGELAAANVASSSITSIGFFVGPFLAGALLAVTSLSVVFAVNVASFLWSAVMIAGLRHATVAETKAETATDEGAGPVIDEPVEATPAEPVAKEGMFAGVGAGFRAILGSRDLRLIVALYVVQTVIAGASLVYEVAIAFELLDLAESGVGLITGALGVGGLFGGMVALVLSVRGKLARDFGLGVVLWGAPLLLVAAFPTLWAALLAMALIGLGNSVVDVNAETIIQRLVPDEVLGRVFGALDAAAIGGMAIGAGLMPILISTIGLRAGLVAIGVATSALVLVSIGGLVRIDRITLAPEGLDLLRAVPIFAPLPENVLELLARRSERVTVAPGDVIIETGEPGDRFYVIETGEVEIEKIGVAVSRLAAGESFGEIALLRDVARTATVTAATDVVLRAIDRRHFIPAVTGHADAYEQAELVVGRYMNAA